MVAIYIQIQTLLAAIRGGEGGMAERSNIGSNINVVKPPVFNREAGNVGAFITVCRLYLRIKMRGTTVEEQI